MAIRETINQHQGITITLLIVAVAAVFWTTLSRMEPSVAKPQVRSAFFSDDDGATFFTDSASNIPPFDHGGKQAVAAHVFRCKDGGEFVGYLEQAKDDHGKLQIAQAQQDLLTEAAKQAIPMPDTELLQKITVNLEVKRPGDKQWVPKVQATRVLNVQCPDGGVATEIVP